MHLVCMNNIWLMRTVHCRKVFREKDFCYVYVLAFKKTINLNNIWRKTKRKTDTGHLLRLSFYWTFHTGRSFTKQNKSVHAWDRCFKNCQTSLVMEWGCKTWRNCRINYFSTILSLKVDVFST